MFEEFQSAINAGNDIWCQLTWKKSSVVSALDEYNSRNGLADWEISNKKELAIELDMLNAIEKLLRKMVKDSI